MRDISLDQRFVRQAIALAAQNPSALIIAVLGAIEAGEILAEGVNRHGEAFS